jgi:hypothetical protein
MQLRSLALLAFTFAASAAVAGYVGIMYDHRALNSAALPQGLRLNAKFSPLILPPSRFPDQPRR